MLCLLGFPSQTFNQMAIFSYLLTNNNDTNSVSNSPFKYSNTLNFIILIPTF